MICSVTLHQRRWLASPRVTLQLSSWRHCQQGRQEKMCSPKPSPCSRESKSRLNAYTTRKQTRLCMLHFPRGFLMQTTETKADLKVHFAPWTLITVRLDVRWKNRPTKKTLQKEIWILESYATVYFVTEWIALATWSTFLELIPQMLILPSSVQ